jgi:hypothetical protein
MKATVLRGIAQTLKAKNVGGGPLVVVGEEMIHGCAFLVTAW